MKQIRWKPYLLFLLLTEAVGALAGFLTRRGVQNYHSVPKSALTPPDWVFPVVWAILFLLMAIGRRPCLPLRQPQANRRSHPFWRTAGGKLPLEPGIL